MNKKERAISIAALTLALQAVPGSGQDCIFKAGADQSLQTALHSFHNVMRALIHGPAERGDYQAVKAEVGKLVERRDEILAARLPENLDSRCIEVSDNARKLSLAVDILAENSGPDAADEAVRKALDRVHESYRNLRTSLTGLGDLLKAFHELMHPLWHEAYPKKDAAAITVAIPKLKLQAGLLVAKTEESVPSRAARARSLQEAVGLLEEAAAKDGPSVLDALRVVHEAFEQLVEGPG